MEFRRVLFRSAFHAEDMTATRREVAHDVAEVLLGHHDVDLHDRLEQVRLRLVHTVLDRHRTGDLERHLARVDGMVRTVDQCDGDVDHRVAGRDARLDRFADALLDRWDVLPRNATLRDLVLEDETAPALARTDHDLGVAVLALAACLADKASDTLGLALDGLLVCDLRLALVGIDTELAKQTVDDDLEVELAHALDDRLARLLVGVHLEGLTLLRQ